MSALIIKNSRKAATDEMAELAKAAVIGRLVPGITHEINNPLSFITTNLSVLVDYCNRLCLQVQRCRGTATGGEADISGSAFDAAAVNSPGMSDTTKDLDYVLSDIFVLLDECTEGLDRIKTLVRDIQQFSPGNDIKTTEISINDCLDTTLNVLRNNLKARTTIDKTYGNTPLITAAPGLVYHFFLNLLLHAAHSIKGKGTMNITTTSDNSQVTVIIACQNAPSGSRDEPDREYPSSSKDDALNRSDGNLTMARTLIQNIGGKLTIEAAAEDCRIYRMALPVRS
jgi:two-component system NtrC family sensor kinase